MCLLNESKLVGIFPSRPLINVNRLFCKILNIKYVRRVFYQNSKTSADGE